MKRLLAMVAAFVAAIALVVLTPTPAHALGWSGQRCDMTHTGQTEEGFYVCTNFYTQSLPSGKVWISTIQTCFGMSAVNNHVKGSFSNGWNATGGAWGGLPDVDKDQCVLKHPTQAAGSVGAGACYNAGGSVNLSLWPDTTWSTRGRVQGGAC